jgi:hypothetical protein
VKRWLAVCVVWSHCRNNPLLPQQKTRMPKFNFECKFSLGDTDTFNVLEFLAKNTAHILIRDEDVIGETGGGVNGTSEEDLIRCREEACASGSSQVRNAIYTRLGRISLTFGDLIAGNCLKRVSTKRGEGDQPPLLSLKIFPQWHTLQKDSRVDNHVSGEVRVGICVVNLPYTEDVAQFPPFVISGSGSSSKSAVHKNTGHAISTATGSKALISASSPLKIRVGDVGSQKMAHSMAALTGTAAKSTFREKLLAPKKSDREKKEKSDRPAFLESPQIVVCVLEGRNLLVVDEESGTSDPQLFVTLESRDPVSGEKVSEVTLYYPFTTHQMRYCSRFYVPIL